MRCIDIVLHSSYIVALSKAQSVLDTNILYNSKNSIMSVKVDLNSIPGSHFV